MYDTANHDERRAILQQFIKEIRVRKDYEISITLNASFNQVEQLKSVSIYDGAEIFEGISEKGAYRPSLGGHINLLYCFFWGIAAVRWMRYGYSLMLKLMKKVRSHIRPWMTAALAVFMAVNMLTSALALARYDARTSGEAPNGQLEVFLDEHFDNARMERIYPNAKKVTKAE